MAENTTPAFRHEFKIETWTLFGVGVFFTLTRLYVENGCNHNELFREHED